MASSHGEGSRQRKAWKQSPLDNWQPVPPPPSTVKEKNQWRRVEGIRFSVLNRRREENYGAAQIGMRARSGPNHSRFEGSQSRRGRAAPPSEEAPGGDAWFAHTEVLQMLVRSAMRV